MGVVRRNIRKSTIEVLEPRQCLSSVGWDGPGFGSAELTYYIGEAPSSLGQSDVEIAIEAALAAWSEVADIEFIQTSTPNLRDSIDFEFGSIDGKFGILAQAYFPDDVNPSRIAGDIEFDSSETWEIGNSQGQSAFDLTLVAVHEIGHSLGIDHIPNLSSVLHASVSPSQTFSELSQADVDAVLALYAPVAASKTTSQQLDPLSTQPTDELVENATEEVKEPVPDPVPRTQWNRWRFIRRGRAWNQFGRSGANSAFESNTLGAEESTVEPHERWTSHIRTWSRFRSAHV